MVSVPITFLLVILVPIETIHVPFVKNPEIVTDGTLNEPSWSLGETISVDPGNTLRVLQDENFLYLAHYSLETGKRYMEILFRNKSGDQMNLHASMQLGERIEGQKEMFRWGLFDGWIANVTPVEDLESDAAINREFRIRKELLGPEPIDLTIRLTSFFDESDALSMKIRLKTIL